MEHEWIAGVRSLAGRECKDMAGTGRISNGFDGLDEDDVNVGAVFFVARYV